MWEAHTVSRACVVLFPRGQDVLPCGPERRYMHRALPTREGCLNLDVHRFLLGLYHVGMM